MKKKAKKCTGKQARTLEPINPHQLLLPMLAGMLTTKEALEAWVHQQGLAVLREVFGTDAERIAGPKGKHQSERRYNHWGSTDVELTFGGRKISVPRPRVRGVDGGEVELPSVEHFSGTDPLPDRVVEQILLGVSTRGYGSSLGQPPPAKSRGTSKSAASRHLVVQTDKRMKKELAKRLDDEDIVVLMLDGIEVAKKTIVVALGVNQAGDKRPLGLWQGSTENAVVCTALLQDLIERGLKINGRTLCVIDGSKALRKALDDVLGDRAVVQRCQVHKRRNVRGHLPKERQNYVDRQMRDAYGSKTAKTARKRLRSLASWLDNNGEPGAAASVREGLEETLTVLKLGLGPVLRRSLATTNAIENLNGTIRRVTRNVKRWRDGEMIRRWAALGVFTAAEKFHRIKGYRDLPKLVQTLAHLDAAEEVA